MGNVVMKRSLEVSIKLPTGSGSYSLAGDLSLWSDLESALALASMLRDLADEFQSLAEAETKRTGAK